VVKTPPLEFSSQQSPQGQADYYWSCLCYYYYLFATVYLFSPFLTYVSNAIVPFLLSSPLSSDVSDLLLQISKDSVQYEFATELFRKSVGDSSNLSVAKLLEFGPDIHRIISLLAVQRPKYWYTYVTLRSYDEIMIMMMMMVMMMMIG